MGEIVISGQKFKIQGENPTAKEQLAIDTFFAGRNQADELTGIPYLDQGQFQITPEDVLSEAAKGKYNKDTESFLSSPEFGRIVAEVGLSIVGGIAGVALAPFTGGGSLVGTAAMATRVASIARPLLNISARQVAKVGSGVVGASLGGGSGAAIAQYWDPKEDIVKEVARGAIQGGLGEVLGVGMAGALGKVYNKVAGTKFGQVKGAVFAKNYIDRQKAFYNALGQIKQQGKLTDEQLTSLQKLKQIDSDTSLLTEQQLKIIKDPKLAEKTLENLERELGTDFLAKIERGTLTPALATDNVIVDTLEGIAETSLFGGGTVMAARTGARLGVVGGINTFVDTLMNGVKVNQLDDMLIMGQIRDILTQQNKVFDITLNRRYKTLGEKIAKQTQETSPSGIIRPKQGMGVNINAKGKTKIYDPSVDEILSKDSVKSYVSNMEKTTTLNDDTKELFRMVLGEADELTYKQSTDLLTRINEKQVFTSQAQKAKGEILNRLYHAVDNAKVPSSILNERNFLRNFRQMGSQQFGKTILTKLADDTKGVELMYKQIIKPGQPSLYLNFEKLLNKSVRDPATGQLVRGIPKAEADLIKNKMKGLFLKDMLGSATERQGQYIVLNSAKLNKFIKNDYKDLIEKGGFFTKQELKELDEIANAFKFAEGQVAAPGTKSSRGKIFVQLKEAGAVSGASMQLVGGAGAATGLMDPTTAGLWILGPAGLAKALTNPTIAKFLIEGIKGSPKDFTQFFRWATQTGRGLVQAGLVSQEDNRLVLNQIKQNENNYRNIYAGKYNEVEFDAGLTMPDYSQAPVMPINLRSDTRPNNVSPRLPVIEPANLSMGNMTSGPSMGGQSNLELAQALNLFK